MSRIHNAGFVPLNRQPQGTVPDVSGALLDRMQTMVFIMVSTQVKAYQALQAGEAVTFYGNIQPFSERALCLRPEGERAWSWYWVHSTVALPLSPDDVVEYLGENYRVMALRDNRIHGFFEYQLVKDYTGSGPTVGGQSL